MAAPTRTARNVLLITADQWRGECLSALGHPMREDPATSTRWRATACCSRATTPTPRPAGRAAPRCTPASTCRTTAPAPTARRWTRATPTGRWSARSAGYDPVLFGYTDTSLDPRDCRRTIRGCAPTKGRCPASAPIVHDGRHAAAWTDWLTRAGLRRCPADPERLCPARRRARVRGRRAASRSRWPIRPRRDDTAFLIDRVHRLHARAPTSPFIAHLSLLRPHPPFDRARALQRPVRSGARARLHARRARRRRKAQQHPWLALSARRKRTIARPADEKKLRRLKAVYYGLMSEVDDDARPRCSRILKASGRWDDTLIVFTSDHGEQMGDHWLLGKCGYFDASYRIPLIVRDPRRDGRCGARHGGRRASPRTSTSCRPCWRRSAPTIPRAVRRPLARRPFLRTAGRAGALARRGALGVRLPRSRRRRRRAARWASPCTSARST